MIRLSISLTHREKVTEMIGPNYMIQSVVVKPGSESTAQVQPYLESGVLRGGRLFLRVYSRQYGYRQDEDLVLEA